jgi:hypothetical protein
MAADNRASVKSDERGKKVMGCGAVEAAIVAAVQGAAARKVTRRRALVAIARSDASVQPRCCAP